MIVLFIKLQNFQKIVCTNIFFILNRLSNTNKTINFQPTGTKNQSFFNTPPH